MAVTADVIGVDIVARVEKLEQGLRRAEVMVDRSAGRMGRSMERIDGGFRRGLGGVRGGFGTLRAAAGGFGAFALMSALQNNAITNMLQAASDAAVGGIFGNRAMVRSGTSTLRGMIDRVNEVTGFQSMANTIFGVPDNAERLFGPHNTLGIQNREADFKLAKELARLEAELKRDAAKEIGDTIKATQIDFELAIQTLEDAIEELNESGIDPRLVEEFKRVGTSRALFERDRARKIDEETMMPNFNTAETLLGTWRQAFRDVDRQVSAAQEAAKEDTAQKNEQNTRKVAALMDDLVRRKPTVIAFG